MPDRSLLLLLIVSLFSLSGCQNKSEDLGGAYYCVFENETEQWWYGVSARPCSSGIPTTNYIRARDLGIGGGFTFLADRCEKPLSLRVTPNDYEIENDGSVFEVRRSSLEEIEGIAPNPECHTVVSRDGIFDRMVAGNPLWNEVRVVN